MREYFRPNLWPNTPDILPEYLQFGGRPAFMIRLVLAATLGASYGIYGPAFELCDSQPREAGSEEYLNSEKFELKHWNIERPDSLKDFIARVNRIRRENAALQCDWNLDFYPIDNEQLICYAKFSEDGANIILMVVNLDPHHTQGGWLELPLGELGLDPGRALPSARSPGRGSFSLARTPQLCRTRPESGPGLYLPVAAPGAHRTGF